MPESRTAEPAQGAISSTKSGVEFVIRPGTKADQAFVARSWVLSLKGANRATKWAHTPTFLRHHHKVVDRLLALPTVRVRVAAPVDDDFTVLGFAVIEPPTLVHMVYVKAPFRRMGIASRLLTGAKPVGLVYTHMTKDARDWIHEKYAGMVFDPYWDEDMNERREG